MNKFEICSTDVLVCVTDHGRAGYNSMTSDAAYSGRVETAAPYSTVDKSPPTNTA